jgi:hypothetical protein
MERRASDRRTCHSHSSRRALSAGGGGEKLKLLRLERPSELDRRTSVPRAVVVLENGETDRDAGI